MKKSIVLSFSIIVFLFLCSCSKNKTELEPSSKVQTEVKDSSNVSKGKITAEMAYEGVNNYCHSEYDWSMVESEGKQPSSDGASPSSDSPMMYVTMGEETESEYQVIFRSYTGALVNFYVDKASGTTRMVEYVPTLDIENEVGTIQLSDYLEKKN
jgi:hypothetical protein